MLDKGLLRIAKHREKFNRIRGELPDSAMGKTTVAILDDFDKYYKDFPSHDKVDMDVFLPRFRRAHPMDDAQWASYLRIFGGIVPDLDEDTEHTVLADMYELKLGTQLANLLAAYEEGESEHFPTALAGLLTEYKQGLGIKEAKWIDTDIGELLAEATDSNGIKWRLGCLNEAMRGLRGGDFGVIAGRPDKGKTTFISSEVTFMANQLPEDRNVLWLNNEGPGKRIVPRLYQSALGMLTTDMVKDHQLGRLVPAYEDAVGRIDRVRVVDIHGLSHYHVENIIESNTPGVIVYDMIDNIHGFGDSARTDQALEKMYQWAREVSVKHDCIGLATSQISFEGDGLQFPPQSALKDSKTGKQGACDFIIMIGATNDPNQGLTRFIGVPKNKLQLPGRKGDPKSTVMMQPDIARYQDIKIQEAELNE